MEVSRSICFDARVSRGPSDRCHALSIYRLLVLNFRCLFLTLSSLDLTRCLSYLRYTFEHALPSQRRKCLACRRMTPRTAGTRRAESVVDASGAILPHCHRTSTHAVLGARGCVEYCRHVQFYHALDAHDSTIACVGVHEHRSSLNAPP